MSWVHHVSSLQHGVSTHIIDTALQQRQSCTMGVGSMRGTCPVREHLPCVPKDYRFTLHTYYHI